MFALSRLIVLAPLLGSLPTAVVAAASSPPPESASGPLDANHAKSLAGYGLVVDEKAPTCPSEEKIPDDASVLSTAQQAEKDSIKRVLGKDDAPDPPKILVGHFLKIYLNIMRQDPGLKTITPHKIAQYVTGLGTVPLVRSYLHLYQQVQEAKELAKREKEVPSEKPETHQQEQKPETMDRALKTGLEFANFMVFFMDYLRYERWLMREELYGEKTPVSAAAVATETPAQKLIRQLLQPNAAEDITAPTSPLKVFAESGVKNIREELGKNYDVPEEE